MRHASIVILMALACMTLPARSAAEGPDVDADGRAVDRASELLRQHKADQALDLLKPIVARTRSGIAEAQGKGLAFCAQDMAEAILYSGMATAAKKTATVFAPAQCTAIYLTAFALNEQRQSAEAITLLRQLVELSPANAQFAIELGFTLRASGDNAKAKAAYEQALAAADMSTNPGSQRLYRAAARRGLGYLLIEAGDLDGAEAMYRKSQEDEPASPVAKAELDYIRKARAGKPAS